MTLKLTVAGDLLVSGTVSAILTLAVGLLAREWVFRLHPPRPQNLGAKAPTPPISNSAIGDAERMRNLVALWIHQNQVVWGRLQTIGVVQVAVIAGWYHTFTSREPERSGYSALISLLGFALSFATLLIVYCDLDRREELRERIVALDGAILPQGGPGVGGYLVITRIAQGFFWLNAALLAWSLVSVGMTFICA